MVNRKMTNAGEHEPLAPLSDATNGSIPYQVIDIGTERKKPLYMGVEEFAESLHKRFSTKDYFTSDDPYNFLVEKSRAQPGLFDQFAAVLKEEAHTNAELNKSIAERIMKMSCIR